jgi:putative ABC transport system ATP-binding protein
VGLADRATHYPAQLSGGEQQRVALARALSTNPKILLADEPTGNLDGKTGELIVELMFRLHEEEGTTMVLITHDDALASKCTHQVRIEDGRVMSRETSREEVMAGE